MSNRLNQEREAKLQPVRMQKAIESARALGFEITHQDHVKIKFDYKGCPITYYPYSGWSSGKTIIDGRGLEHLLIQIKK